MTTVLIAIHIIACIFLIAVVLLQRGKGAEIGAVFGGGASSTVFGSRGAGNFLTKLTTVSAVVFMLTSLTLSYLWTSASSDRLFDEEAVVELEEEAAALPESESLFEEIETVPAEPAPQAAAEETPPAPEEAPAAP